MAQEARVEIPRACDEEIATMTALIDVAAKALADAALSENSTDPILESLREFLTEQFKRAAYFAVTSILPYLNSLPEGWLISKASDALYALMQDNLYVSLTYSDERLRTAADNGAKVMVKAILAETNPQKERI